MKRQWAEQGRARSLFRRRWAQLNRDGETYGEVKQVVSYRDDVFVWVYLDQVDKVIRYEAYVIGYDDRGEPSTLDFVLEEGLLDNVHEVPLFLNLLQRYCEREAVSAPGGSVPFADGKLVTAPTLFHFYRSLSADELEEVHAYFADQEAYLKEKRRSRWVRMLRALGYDV